jgi:REP element-mobilizing transposase RayT
MKYDPKTHRRRSIRLKGYDYTQAGAYFITICSHQREHVFGEVVNGEMKLSKFGLVAKQQWEKLPKRFPNIELGAFALMPNHGHGVIQIIEHERRGIAEDGRRGTADKLNDHIDESSRRAPTERFQKPVAGSIPTIVRSYKSAVAYRINLVRGTNDVPVWQRNYYEHIVRNERELELITKYIDYNPFNWQLDRDNLDNIRNLSTPESVDDYLKDAEEMMGVKTL